MEWCRQYHGEACDPRWLGIAKQAGEGATPGHVAAIVWTLKEHASRAKPRGCVAAFDCQAISDFYTWPVEQIEAIVAAIGARGLIVDDMLVGWDDAQPVKHDKTNAKRQKAYRERQKAVPQEPAADHESNESNARYGVTNAPARSVTLTEEKEQSNCSYSDASKQDTNTSLKLDTPRNVRGQAGAFINPGDFWTWLTAEGIPAHIGTRTMNRGRIVEWAQQGLTQQQLDEALRRARQKRVDEKSGRPVNLGLLACFVDDVLAGKEPSTKTGGRNERGDQLSREFANVG